MTNYEIGDVFFMTPPTVNVWQFESTGEAYDATQCNEEIKNGDVLVIASEGVVGIADTWPIAVTTAFGKLHALAVGTFESYLDERGIQLSSLEVAKQEIAKLGQ